MFNTVMGGSIGLTLLLTPRLWAQLSHDRVPHTGTGGRSGDLAGWTVCFAVLGLVLTPLGFALIVGIPGPADPIGAILGGPWLLLGVLLLAAAWHLRRLIRYPAPGGEAPRPRLPLAPASWIVCWLGVALAVCTAAIIRFDLVHQPQLAGLPQGLQVLGRVFFAVPQYGLAALGCVLAPLVVYRGSRAAWLILYWSWTISGSLFAGYSALNIYTQTAMLIGYNGGAGGRW